MIDNIRYRLATSLMRNGLFRSVAALILAATLPIAGCKGDRKQGTPNQSQLDWRGASSIEVPLLLDRHGLPTIDVRIQGRTVSANIDSGAYLSATNLSLGQANGIDVAHPAIVNGRVHKTIRNVPVQLGQGILSIDRVVMGDLPKGMVFLLGFDLFAHAVLDMDFDAGRLTIMRPDSFQPPVEEPIHIGVSDSLPTVRMKLNGQAAVCAIVDTGINAGVHLQGKLAVELRLTQDPARKTVRTVFGGKRQVMPALVPLEELQIGPRVYQAVPASMSPESKGSCRNLLGMAVLSRHRVIFDIPHNRMWLLPRPGSP